MLFRDLAKRQGFFYFIVTIDCTKMYFFTFHFCPIHVVTFTLISNLATDYIQKRRGEPGLFSLEYTVFSHIVSSLE